MSDAIWFYLGTYTGIHSKGIYLVRLDAATGTLDAPALAGEDKNPSFLAKHPTRPLLYSVCEVNAIDGRNTGAVSAFKIDPVSRSLTRLNDRSSEGQAPCFISVDASGHCVLAANYSTADVASFPILPDGSLGKAASVMKQEGRGPIPGRQEHAFAHNILPDPSGRFALSCDLGADRIFVYSLNAAAATLKPADPPSHSIAAGSGPRHIAFSADGKFAYVINEMANTLTALSWDAVAGRLATLQTISILPADFKGENTGAEVVVHPSGAFVYGSNRGHDSIAVFATGTDGQLTLVEHVSTQGKGPRSFAIDPSGSFLVAANEKSDSLIAYRVDSKTGGLTPTGHASNIGQPVCVLFC